jgi:hypothetical protein
MNKFFITFCTASFILSGLSSPALSVAAVVADHTIVDQYDKIPAYWINEVKKMWLDVPGESHSSGYRRGLQLLAQQNSLFAVSVTESGTPEGYRSDALRASSATWGDVDSAAGWQYSYGEEDFWTSQQAVDRTKAHLTYANTNSLAIAAFGFGWCWDTTWHNGPGGTVDPVYNVRWAGSTVGGPSGDLRWGLDDNDNALTGNTLNMDDYLAAVDAYRAHCAANGYPTKMFFTTSPVDGYTGESGYQRYLKHEHIRKHVLDNESRILFDYADILCYSDSGELNEVSWTDGTGGEHYYPHIHPDNMLDLNGSYAEDGDHIGEVGTIRLGKALWWMLARMAGWNGLDNSTSTTTTTAAGSTTTQPLTTTTIQQATTTIAPVTTTVPATTTIGGTTTTTPVTTTAPATTSTITPITTTVPATTTIGGTTTTTINGTTTTTPVTTTVSATTTTIAPITTTVPPTTTIVVITTTIGGTTTTAPVTTTVPATTTTTAPGTTTVPVTTTIGGTTTSTISDNTTSTTTTPAACSDKDADGYGDNCTAGPDCNDNDSLYNEVCPDCTVTVIPGSLGWFLGEKEKTRRLLVIGNKGTEFAEATPVRWETDAIAVLSKRVLFKRFMLIKVRIDGEALGKGDYRVLIGTCSGKLTLVK